MSQVNPFYGARARVGVAYLHQSNKNSISSVVFCSPAFIIFFFMVLTAFGRRSFFPSCRHPFTFFIFHLWLQSWQIDASRRRRLCLWVIPAFERWPFATRRRRYVVPRNPSCKTARRSSGRVAITAASVVYTMSPTWHTARYQIDKLKRARCASFTCYFSIWPVSDHPPLACKLLGLWSPVPLTFGRHILIAPIRRVEDEDHKQQR